MKILIIRISSLGDIILTEPVVRELKEKYPDSELHFLSRSPMQQIFTYFEKDVIFHDWKNKKECLSKLKEIEFDLIVDLHRKLNTFLIKKSLSAKKIVSYDKQRFHRWMLVRKLNKIPIDTTLKSYFSALTKAGIDHSYSVPKFQKNPIIETEVQQKMQDFNINFKNTIIGIFPGATHDTKRYPEELWVRFIDMVPKYWNIQFVLLGGHQEKGICAKIKRKCTTKIIDFCGATSIKELISAVSICDGILSNDSGPMHIAAAFRKPQIAIFGATHTSLGFRPLNENAIVMQANISCQPCSLHGGKTCPKNSFLCMYKIYPASIFKEFKKMFEEKIVQKEDH